MSQKITFIVALILTVSCSNFENSSQTKSLSLSVDPPAPDPNEVKCKENFGQNSSWNQELQLCCWPNSTSEELQECEELPPPKSECNNKSLGEIKTIRAFAEHFADCDGINCKDYTYVITTKYVSVTSAFYVCKDSPAHGYIWEYLCHETVNNRPICKTQVRDCPSCSEVTQETVPFWVPNQNTFNNCARKNPKPALPGLFSLQNSLMLATPQPGPTSNPTPSPSPSPYPSPTSQPECEDGSGSGNGSGSGSSSGTGSGTGTGSGSGS